jgi:hypothetical protein
MTFATGSITRTIFSALKPAASLQAARRMKAAGVALEDIAAFTGLSSEQIALL